MGTTWRLGALALLLGLLGGAGAGPGRPAARGQEQAQGLSDQERAQLEQQVADLNRQVDAHYRQGRPAEALRLAEQSLGLSRKLYPRQRYRDGHPDLAPSLNNLGLLLRDRGELDKAEPLYRDALAMRQRLYPRERYPDGHP